MYSYKIWEGCYSDYHERVIYHENKFSENEFIDMFNEAVENEDKDLFDVADYLIEKHGFNSGSFIQQVLQVGTMYGPLKKINPETKKSAPEDNEDFRTEIF